MNLNNKIDSKHNPILTHDGFGDYFEAKSERDTRSRARFLPMIGAVLQILQMLALEAVCLLTRSLHSSHITCPT